MHYPGENEIVSREEIMNQIHELEDGYASALKDGESAHTLKQVYHHIQQLYRELKRADDHR
jgi:transcriptional regulator of NAD metabolism